MIAWIPTPDPPPETWMFASGCVAEKLSATACAIGRTVVEPLSVRVSLWDVAAGAFVAAGALLAGVAAAVAGAVVVALLLVHPATRIVTISNAARHAVTNTYELRWDFMMFDHEFIPVLIYSFST
jgi:hypothetical protein